MKARPLFRWIVANALGLAVGFLAALQIPMLIDFGFNWEMHWKWDEGALDQDVSTYLSNLAGFLAAGFILGSAQALVLRSRLMRVESWVLAAGVGFGICALFIDWPLIATGLMGAIPGPVEPFIVTVVGGSFAGVAQHLMLRKKGIKASRWLLLWILGLVGSVVPTGVLFISLEALGVPIGWPAEVFLNGLVAAGVAAWLSGNALFAALSVRE